MPAPHSARLAVPGQRAFPLLAAAVCLVASSVQADQFTYLNDEGETVEVEARLAGSGDGMHALELADGRILLVPQAAVKKRTPAPDPEPLSPEEVVEKLTEQFGKERFRAGIEKPYVIGVVLTAPLPKGADARLRSFRKKAGRFMRNVENIFVRYAKSMRFDTAPPRYPLVVLIFETDDDFERYAEEMFLCFSTP